MTWTGAKAKSIDLLRTYELLEEVSTTVQLKDRSLNPKLKDSNPRALPMTFHL